MKWGVPSILVLIFFSGFIISELFFTTNLSTDIITGIIGGIIACFISFSTKNTKFEYVVNGYILATTFIIWGYMVGGPFVFFITLAVYFPVIYIMANSQYEPGWIEGVVFLFPLFILFISISLLFPINIIGFFVLVFTMANNAYKITLYELFEKSAFPKNSLKYFMTYAIIMNMNVLIGTHWKKPVAYLAKRLHAWEFKPWNTFISKRITGGPVYLLLNGILLTKKVAHL